MRALILWLVLAVTAIAGQEIPILKIDYISR